MKNYTTIACIGWHLLLAVAVTYISYCFRLDITFKDVDPIISILQNTSAMIFTIMGIWIAYVYPNAVLKIVQPSKVTTIFSEDDLKRVKLLVGVVISSAFILLLLLTGVTLKTFLTKTDIFARYWQVFTGIGLWCLLSLIYAQLFCIYAVITSSVNFIIDLKNLNTKKRLSEKLDGKQK
ncbi:hypothetical protein L1C84_15540 [Klebsiella pneumoniae]|uniref:hypothetical protein n=1 Tax=Klebsiella pneumoniae TaxID=573 RepID=UPI000E2BF923|nr:hypothetical protein [Klebsiella pneumoniae]MCQ0753906.1 hypothetical protein [Klebsiella pneumoniae]SXZ61527.1 Uncharacterised protein [Klebsiella pneumoniae]